MYSAKKNRGTLLVPAPRAGRPGTLLGGSSRGPPRSGASVLVRPGAQRAQDVIVRAAPLNGAGELCRGEAAGVPLLGVRAGPQKQPHHARVLPRDGHVQGAPFPDQPSPLLLGALETFFTQEGIQLLLGPHGAERGGEEEAAV